MVESILAALSYVMGSIPFGLIFVKFFLNQDVRQMGSGNIGTTNVMRTGKKWIGVLTYACDIGKIWLPVFISSYFIKDRDFLTLIGGAGVLGHMFSLFLGFKGGKGIASFSGLLLTLYPFYALGMGIIFVIVLVSRRMVSFASLVSTSVITIYIISHKLTSSQGQHTYVSVATLSFLFIAILIRHKDNIKRLWLYQEPKIGRQGKI